MRGALIRQMDQPLAAAVPIYVPPQTEVPPPKSESVVSARITETALVRRNDEDPEADLHYVLIITV